MSGRILIVDPVPTNRIVLRVKMMAAQYMVETSESCADALARIRHLKPDLILINLFDRVEDGFAFCRDLRSDPDTSDIAIVSVGASASAQARFRAMDAGADDVLPRPISDTLLMSRVRSLLRRKLSTEDLILRDGPGAYGFEEDAAPRLTPARVTLICQNTIASLSKVKVLQAGLRHPVQMASGPRHLATQPDEDSPDLIVIHGADGITSQSELIQQVCDLKSRPALCHAAQLVIVPAGAYDLAAMLLDMGAADVVYDDTSPEELVLRARNLIRHKLVVDQLRERLRHGLRAAVTDPLTGLHNRRYAEAQLRRISDRARQTDHPYAVLLLDIDHFKSINDRFGHAIGDLVLTQLSDRLRNAMREGDLLARIGGEEFMIALPDTDIARARQAAERLRMAIGSKPFDLGADRQALVVTVSVGVAVHDGLVAAPSDSFGSMFAQADAALYCAKSAGRDAVSIAKTAA